MNKTYTLNELGKLIGEEVCGNGQRIISGLSEIHTCSRDRLSFIDSIKLADELPLEIAVVADKENFPPERDGLKVRSFRAAMGKLLGIFEPQYPHKTGISPMAYVAPTAKVSPTASIGPNCTVCDGAEIGDRACLVANVYVGPDVQVGEDTVLEPMVVLQRRTKVGARCLIHSCAVLGADGFGIIPGGVHGTNVKIPQIGYVNIGDDVEIGACTCIDRATIEQTQIGSSTKIDNQVQIGHNCHVGRDCIIASQSGIAGSTTIEDGVVMGARSGLNGHIKIAQGTMIAGLAIVMKDTKPGQMLSGHPATDHMKDFRFKASLRSVPEMLKRIKKIEKAIQHESSDTQK
jgi:UDP-3-O-[3-hydroxymyristoyl] glucosamine N-acyltransferase